MSLKAAQESIANGHVCQFVTVYRHLDDDDRKTLNEWVGEIQTPHWIFVACSVAGVRVAEKTLRKHLQGYCHCPPGTELKGVYRVAA